MTLQLSEIDYPLSWPDQHTLRATASGCMLTEHMPGDFEVWIDDARFIEVVHSWYDNATDNFQGLWLRADLSEAIDDFIATLPEPEHMLDWAMNFELLAARLRTAARGEDNSP